MTRVMMDSLWYVDTAGNVSGAMRLGAWGLVRVIGRRYRLPDSNYVLGNIVVISQSDVSSVH